MAPDGNGGVYMALRASGALADMAAHGVEAVDCYCVDNALVRLGDPLFVGYCHERGIECGELQGRGSVDGWRWFAACAMLGPAWRWMHAWQVADDSVARSSGDQAGSLHQRQGQKAERVPASLPPLGRACCPLQGRASWPRPTPRRRWACLRAAAAPWRWSNTRVRGRGWWRHQAWLAGMVCRLGLVGTAAPGDAR